MSYTQVVEGIYRGPRPRGPVDLPPGIKTVLNLESGWWEAFHDEIYGEDVILDKLKIIHVPINAMGCPPSLTSLQIAYRVLVDVTYPPIYVHCKQGVDRTGMVIAYYRVKQQGWSVDKAITEMLEMGFHSIRYFWWIPYFEKIVREN